MTPDELIGRLIEVADDVGPLVAPPSVRQQLSAICATARVALGAAAVSIARVIDDALRFEASDGEGAAEIVGTELSLGEGIAGYVAGTGQAMVVDRVQSDPRFARDVAESTGYVPTSLLVAPVTDPSGAVIGVVSVLDRSETESGADALAVATSVATQAALLLPTVEAVTRLGPLLIESLVIAVAGDADLADGLRLAVADAAPGDQELGSMAALLAELRTMSPQARQTVERVLTDVLDLARRRRR